VSGDTGGHSFGNALRTTSIYKSASSSNEVIRSLLAELTTHKTAYKTTYVLQRCSSAGAGEYYNRDFRDLTSELTAEIIAIMSEIETRTNAMLKKEAKEVTADHFLFHALMEKARKPVAYIITTTEGETYLNEMHTTAIRSEGTFDRDIIVVHFDERSSKYRVLLEPKKATLTTDRDGMNNELILPSMETMYGDDYDPTSHNHRLIDHTKYQVDVDSSPGGMEVIVDGLHVSAYSPDTQLHVLEEINLQGAAGGGHRHLQIALRSDGETHNA